MADAQRFKGNVDFSQCTQGSNDLGRMKNKKSDRSRRSWSAREEEVLLLTLKELVAHGWKSDNGFRAGYLNKLEEALRREFPATDLKVNPHIISKITAWKKNYYSLQGILSRSGVGFNLNGDYKIECDEEQWEQVLKIDANSRFIRNKSWPYLDDWKEIFGKDRATGSGAEDILEAVNGLYSDENFEIQGVNTDYNVSIGDFFANDPVADDVEPEPVADSVCQSSKDSQLPKRSSRKRKALDGIDEFYELFKKMHEDTNTRLESLSSRIGYEVDLSKARKEVFELLGRIPGLSLEQKFDVCDILVKEPERLDLFISLPEPARPAYVLRILEKQRNK